MINFIYLEIKNYHFEYYLMYLEETLRLESMRFIIMFK